MGSLEAGLTKDELLKARGFFKRLKNPDSAHVKKVIASVDAVAESYFASDHPKRNLSAFCDEDKVGYPFFSVYLIGGYLNKQGERPDIDLLVSTNMRWIYGFSDGFEVYDEPIWKSLRSAFPSSRLRKNGMLPDDYTVGLTKGKILITITPRAGKKIDICYVRSWNEKGYKFIDVDQFAQLDVGEDGKPLPRLPLCVLKG